MNGEEGMEEIKMDGGMEGWIERRNGGTKNIA